MCMYHCLVFLLSISSYIGLIVDWLSFIIHIHIWSLNSVILSFAIRQVCHCVHFITLNVFHLCKMIYLTTIINWLCISEIHSSLHVGRHGFSAPRYFKSFDDDSLAKRLKSWSQVTCHSGITLNARMSVLAPRYFKSINDYSFGKSNTSKVRARVFLVSLLPIYGKHESKNKLIYGSMKKSLFEVVKHILEN